MGLPLCLHSIYAAFGYAVTDNKAFMKVTYIALTILGLSSGCSYTEGLLAACSYWFLFCFGYHFHLWIMDVWISKTCCR